MTQNPKTVTGKLEVLGESPGEEDEDDAQERTLRGADCGGAAAGRGRRAGGRDLPQGGNQLGNLLPVEEAVCRVRGERTA